MRTLIRAGVPCPDFLMGFLTTTPPESRVRLAQDARVIERRTHFEVWVENPDAPLFTHGIYGYPVKKLDLRSLDRRSSGPPSIARLRRMCGL